MRTLISSLAVAALLLLTVPIGAQQHPDPALLSGLKFRSIGPTSVGGRIDDFAVGRVAGQPDAIYVGSASGGVFKSVNGGVSWTPVFDHVDGMMSIGAVAVSKSNPNIVWTGTGEANNRQSSSWGDGVYRSTDAGKTWTNMGLKETRHVGRIVIDPTNPDVVYVAGVGHLWGSNPDRGVFKTSDGGKTWARTLFVDDNTGATDLVIDPQNARTLYAAMYQRQRKSWGFVGGGPGSGIYKSTDAGQNWKKLTTGLPAGDKGRIGLDVFNGDSKIVYAMIEAAVPDNGLYRSVDAGDTWERMNTQNVRPSYYTQIRIDPKDRNRVYELGSNRGFFLSDDAGKTFKDIFQSAPGQSLIHGEDHALWVDPDDPNHMIIGGDGGVSISWDRGLSWDFKNNIPVGQFYEIDVDMKVPFTVCGGLQDNGEWCVPSSVRDRNGIANSDSWNIGGGDGFYVKFDRSDENYAYAESQDGNASRVNLTTLERQSVKPRGDGGQALRFNWDTPIMVSNADPKVIYMAAERLFRSPDRGVTWATISGDLTSGVDPATLPIMGAPVAPNALSKGDGTSSHTSITSVSESPLNPQVLYTGAQDGTVQGTKDGGKTWTNLTAKLTGIPPMTYVSTVLASKYAVNRVYATFDGHYSDDYKPYVLVSDDYGLTWRSIVTGLPETSINRIREHPSDPNFLVLGHEKGVHFSTDAGKNWMPLSQVTNLPNAPTDDIVIHPRDNALVLGTHGRGIIILDDIGPLQLMKPETLASDAALAPIAPAHGIITHNVQAWYGAGHFFAPNADVGAGINYYLRDGASGSVEIVISDASGKKVRTLSGGTMKGINHTSWDLRADPPAAVPGAPAAPGGGRGGGGGGGGGGGSQGALVSPGTYTVVVTIPGIARQLRGTVTVDSDPIATAKR